MWHGICPPLVWCVMPLGIGCSKVWDYAVWIGMRPYDYGIDPIVEACHHVSHYTRSLCCGGVGIGYEPLPSTVIGHCGLHLWELHSCNKSLCVGLREKLVTNFRHWCCGWCSIILGVCAVVG
jgi:hypothetical protein